MIVIGQGAFVLQVTPPSGRELRRFGTSLFRELDESAQVLPIPDYGLHIEVEEGSLKGKSAILATATAFYFGVGHFGEFIHGLKEIAALGRSVADHVNKVAPALLGAPRTVMKTSRTDAGTLTQLNKLFERVANRELSPAEATNMAMKLLDSEDQIPPELMHDLATSFEKIRIHPRQLELLSGLEAVSIATTIPKQPRRRTPPDELIDRRIGLRLEIDRPDKRSKPSIRLTRIRK